jgi:hypothetical protein
MKKTINTDLGPIIAKLHVLCKPTGIFGPIFEKDNCEKFIARQQNYKFASLHIPKKSNKIKLSPRLYM